MVELFANMHSVASDLGLHCLPVTRLGVSSLQWVKQICSSFMKRRVSHYRVHMFGAVMVPESLMSLVMEYHFCPKCWDTLICYQTCPKI